MWVSPKSLTGVSPQTSPLESAGLDQLDPYFHKLTRDFILELLTSIFNILPSNNEISVIWKSAYVLLLLEGNYPSVTGQYLNFSKGVLAKVFQRLINEQLKYFFLQKFYFFPTLVKF